ncbi:response regulator [Jiella endophytica]|uniref:Response regulator n=1 Tax=Jiella endophytica TaxID=2558362 RepID=A0A4Y8RBE5_9HYPH|nr:response regulator [Jiella endophytica]TFF18738.1 response regulator [Jiella endophytica]
MQGSGIDRVLIVEDDFLAAMMLSQMLEEIGFEICGTAASEDDAVQAAIDLRPHLVISDFRLKSGDGVSASERIRDFVDVPVLFVSGSSDEVRGRAPAAVCIDKPYTLDGIRRGILTVLSAQAPVIEMSPANCN